MITINDNDTPLTVAEKIIKATDQYSIGEIKEIADYLWVYCLSHEKYDGLQEG